MPTQHFSSSWVVKKLEGNLSGRSVIAPSIKFQMLRLTKYLLSNWHAKYQLKPAEFPPRTQCMFMVLKATVKVQIDGMEFALEKNQSIDVAENLTALEYNWRVGL